MTKSLQKLKGCSFFETQYTVAVPTVDNSNQITHLHLRVAG